MLSVFYNNDKRLGENFNRMVTDVFKSYNSLNYMLLRDKPYNPKGRFQTEEESDGLISPMKNLLSKEAVVHSVYYGNQQDYDKIVLEILEKLKSQ